MRLYRSLRSAFWDSLCRSAGRSWSAYGIAIRAMGFKPVPSQQAHFYAYEDDADAGPSGSDFNPLLWAWFLASPLRAALDRTLARLLSLAPPHCPGSLGDFVLLI